jgi:hypothetical protein
LRVIVAGRWLNASRLVTLRAAGDEGRRKQDNLRGRRFQASAWAAIVLVEARLAEGGWITA